MEKEKAAAALHEKFIHAKTASDKKKFEGEEKRMRMEALQAKHEREESAMHEAQAA